MTDCFLAVLGFSRLFREKGFFFFLHVHTFCTYQDRQIKKKKNSSRKVGHQITKGTLFYSGSKKLCILITRYPFANSKTLQSFN